MSMDNVREFKRPGSTKVTFLKPKKEATIKPGQIWKLKRNKSQQNQILWEIVEGELKIVGVKRDKVIFTLDKFPFIGHEIKKDDFANVFDLIKEPE